jgi:hypothetical protein
MDRLRWLLLLPLCAALLAPGGDAPPVEKKVPENAAIEKTLEKRISFDFVNTPVGDALGFLRGVLEVNLVVHPGVNRDATITLKVSEMKAGHALRWIAELVGATAGIEHGAIFVRPAPEEKEKPEKPPVEKEKEDPDTRKVRKRLKGRTLSFDFVETPLQDVVSFIAALVDATIVLDPDLDPDRPVTLRLTDVSAASALHWVARVVGAEVEMRQGAVFLRNTGQAQQKGEAKPGGGHL